MWTRQSAGTATSEWGRDSGYGMGWEVVPSRQEYGGGDAQKFAVGHDGGAVGASSILLMFPTNVPHPSAAPVPSSSHIPVSPNSLSVVSPTTDACIPCGMVVAIITNLQGVGLQRLATDIAALFCETATLPNNTNPYG
jgi:serine beta-lactamase-like protein LACTB